MAFSSPLDLPSVIYRPCTSAGIDYLTNDLPSRGHKVHSIEPHKSAVLNALETPDFDVLHITCHGKADLKEYGEAAMILGDRRANGKKMPISLNTTRVKTKARLDHDGRARIVFLNACETGQQAPILTDWGGWRQTFWQRGAAVFVGTSWAVSQEAAAMFTKGFYEALLDGSTLAAAAVEGRKEARKVGDGSWLAYVVYGSPMARINASKKNSQSTDTS